MSQNAQNDQLAAGFARLLNAGLQGLAQTRAPSAALVVGKGGKKRRKAGCTPCAAVARKEAAAKRFGLARGGG